MKKLWNRYICTAILFLAILYGFMTKITLTSAAEIYHTIKATVKEEKTQKEFNLFTIVKSGIYAAENQLNENFPYKMAFINVHGLFNRMLGKKLIVDSANSFNDVYKMTNGQLTYSYPVRNLDYGIENMLMLKKFCNEKEIPLIYIQFPFKVNKYNNMLPHGMEDMSNENCDVFLKEMENIHIPCIDYREILQEMDAEYDSLFFNTDHHWKTETAFYSYGYFMDYLKKNYGYSYNLENTREENFNFVTLKKSFIGSQANRTGLWYGGVDDFTYIYPDFNTDFLWEKYNKNGKKTLTREGDFKDTLLFREVLENPEVPMAYRDSCYFNGNPAVTVITNNQVKEGSILMVSDSFSKPFNSFLALNFHQTVFMDLRDYKKSLLKYIGENEFDYVVIAYNASAYKGVSYKQFFAFDK